jgi:methyl-accepting chemotaxis protein
VTEVAGAADSIRSGVEQQQQVAQLIGENASHAAHGAKDMAIRIAEVANVATAAQELSSQVEAAANSLTTSAATLENATASFVAHLHAA